jgi:hypothetical protein
MCFPSVEYSKPSPSAQEHAPNVAQYKKGSIKAQTRIVLVPEP